jgi:hypothetical protein
MKAVFIDELHTIPYDSLYFTLYKIYDVEQSDILDNLYKLKNDMGGYVNIKKTRFMPLYEWRNNQIDEILKD